MFQMLKRIQNTVKDAIAGIKQPNMLTDLPHAHATSCQGLTLEPVHSAGHTCTMTAAIRNDNATASTQKSDAQPALHEILSLQWIGSKDFAPVQAGSQPASASHQ